MVVDTSVFTAIVLVEPDAATFDERIRSASACLVSVASWIELGVVLTTRLGVDARPVLDRLKTEYDVTLVPVDVEQMTLAADALFRFGKGRHPARLNYGDSFAYALSRATGEPLLFKGDDFARTDVGVA